MNHKFRTFVLFSHSLTVLFGVDVPSDRVVLEQVQNHINPTHPYFGSLWGGKNKELLQLYPWEIQLTLPPPIPCILGVK